MSRILIVIMHLEMGGAEKSLVNFLNELNPQTTEVDLLLIKKRGILKENEMGTCGLKEKRRGYVRVEIC